VGTGHNNEKKTQMMSCDSNLLGGLAY